MNRTSDYESEGCEFKYRRNHKEERKSKGFQNYNCVYRNNFVPLHPQIGNGSVAQLNRASDYGSEGCGFESRRNHKNGCKKSRNNGSVAQLNRASDYGSEGCGFESRRNHQEERKSKGFLFFFFAYSKLFCIFANKIGLLWKIQF